MPPPKRPKPLTYADIVAELKAAGEMPAPIPVQPEPSPYQYATPDPMAQAQHLAERQQAAGQLGAPMTPMLEVPGQTMSLVDQLVAVWNSRRPKK